MARPELPRKLRAILAADIEGYSRFIGDDDAGTVRLLSRYRGLLQDGVARFHGNVFSEAGDGFFVEFENAEEAVLCAVNVQKAIAKANVKRGARSMWFRMGVSLGDIIDDGKTKHGHAINIAARIQTIADPGGLCITSPVFEQVANKLPYAFDDLGPAHLKNISWPVNLVKVRWAEQPPSMAPDARSRRQLGSDKPSLAVLPFELLGPHEGQEYLADGLVEEIITELSRYRWLSVVSKGSSSAYKTRKVDPRLVARELGVRYVIEGSLRREADKLRIILHLVLGETGEELWSGRFDRLIQEVFELQDDVVIAIAGAIEPRVKVAEIYRSRRKPTRSLTAYDYYLQALPYRAAINQEGNEIALALLEKAIALDPHFAPALALASMCYITRKDQGWGALDREAISTALRLARAAVEIDFDHPTVLYVSGHTLASLGADLSNALSLMDRALEINPSSAEGWARSSMVRIYAGDLATAERHAETSIRLSPLDERLFLPLCALGYCYLFSGRYEQAVDAAQRSLRGRQRPPMAYIILLSAMCHQGDSQGASKAAAALLETAPAFHTRQWLAQSCFVLEEQRKIFEGAFDVVGLPS
jgi:adenylate cyclase